ncbi:MAG: cystathionine gamma-synthase [Chromatiales bacterium]|nr:MAG: cystathionine gamma-synthase [Chromatiales bacterium]
MSQDNTRQTRAVRAAVHSDTQHGAVMPPLYLTSNFAFEGLGKAGAYDYTRTANPTRDALANALTELEGGAGATVTASGMAAIHLACQLLNPGDLVVGPRDCYGGTFRLLTQCAQRGLFRVELIDQADVAALDAVIAQEPRLLWVESPTNPLMRVIDLAALSQRAKTAGALMAVDNTFLSPALQRPLALGADLVVHSTTKYLNGHSDMVGGAVIAGTPELAEQLAYWGNAVGLTGSPFDAFLTLRGIRTLYARMRQHEENALALAELLAGHPAVTRVHYPGLPSHPDHALAKRQQSGFGGMLSFELTSGEAGVRALLEAIELYTLAESLGGVESLICHPASMSHATFDAASLAAAGIGAGLLRISVGIESTDDLVRDLARGLDAAG